MVLMTQAGVPMGLFELTFKKRYAHCIINQISPSLKPLRAFQRD